MNISFLITKDLLNGGGGVEKYTREVGRRLVARGHQVTVYSTRGTGSCPDLWEGIKIRWMPRIRPHWAEKVAGSLNATALALIDHDPPDIFHLQSVAAGGMAQLLGFRGVPCILQMHGVEWQRSRWGRVAKATLRLLELVSFSNAAAVTAVSKGQCDFYRQRYNKEVSFIPGGTDLSKPVPAIQLSRLGIEPAKYFLTAVRLVQEKGVHYLIPAFRKISTDWSLVIAGGDGGDKKYVDYLHELAAGDERIRFLGHVRPSMLAELYCHAGAYVQASEIEGMSLSLLDAMTSGCCCIVSDIDENIDVLGDAGLKFRSKDADHLASQMSWVIQSGSASAVFGSLAQERVRSRYSWDVVTSQLEQLYLETANVSIGKTGPLPTSIGHEYSAPTRRAS